MARWDEVERSDPDFAAAVRARFDAHRHALLATLRRDGSPRISGIETTFTQGDLWLGMMPGSMKARDLRRDPRLALHSSSPDPPEDATAWDGDAKLAGTAEEVTDEARVAAVALAMGVEASAAPPPMHLFRVDVAEAVLTRVSDTADHLVVELWRPGEDLRRFERA